MAKGGVKLRRGRDQVRKAVKLLEDRSKRRPVGGNTLLAALAARIWSEVTEGKGVVLDEQGKAVKPGGDHD